MPVHSALELFQFSHEIQKRQIVMMMDEMTIVKPETSVKTWWMGYIKLSFVATGGMPTIATTVKGVSTRTR